VIDGADKLRDGAKINVRSEANPTSSPDTKSPDQDKPGGKKRRSDGGQKQ
jgi:multidrug efflux system membrane fusion protein